ncbi:hypothetical protein AYJ54_00535 [Bradyrhizobium centrolobii]|uniref:Uncharacterized protein n=1 Tax=Bradyrhizobium centrolobii TaxID=1505087 RepID=A0A176YIC6_9BRAD|nr:hypothetical protein [Bradyrhizobium centrolobii]OAF05426.1 hypothetical protein AYJ54_00535 [Bradyrhizobium centrolobii]
MSELVKSLRARGTMARKEHTGTADADAWHFDKAADEIERLLSLVEKLTAPTDEMIDAFFKSQKAYAEPYPAEFESGVEMDSGLDQETADLINEDMRATFREGWKAALSNPSTMLQSGNSK